MSLYKIVTHLRKVNYELTIKTYNFIIAKHAERLISTAVN